jgi:hypothetical protein
VEKPISEFCVKELSRLSVDSLAGAESKAAYMDKRKNEDFEIQNNHGNEVEQKLNETVVCEAGYSNSTTTNNDLKY